MAGAHADVGSAVPSLHRLRSRNNKGSGRPHRTGAGDPSASGPMCPDRSRMRWRYPAAADSYFDGFAPTRGQARLAVRWLEELGLRVIPPRERNFHYRRAHARVRRRRRVPATACRMRSASYYPRCPRSATTQKPAPLTYGGVLQARRGASTISATAAGWLGWSPAYRTELTGPGPQPVRYVVRKTQRQTVYNRSNIACKESPMIPPPRRCAGGCRLHLRAGWPYATMLLADPGPRWSRSSALAAGTTPARGVRPAPGRAVHVLPQRQPQQTLHRPDLTDPDDLAVAQQPRAHATSWQNYKPGGLRRFGLDHTSVAEVNPGSCTAHQRFRKRRGRGSSRIRPGAGDGWVDEHHWGR